MLAPESEVYAADEAEDNISPTEKGEFSKPSWILLWIILVKYWIMLEFFLQAAIIGWN